MESMQEIGMREVTTSYFYRAEEGQRGDGRWPPQARDTGRGMRSRAEVYRRPPDGAKRRRGALAEFRRRRKGCECDGVGTRRVETPRGKGAKRLAGSKLRIDRGGMGGGGSLGFFKEKLDSTTESALLSGTCSDAISTNKGFTQSRDGIFHYCLRAHKNSKGSGSLGEAPCPGEYFIQYCANHDSVIITAHNFMHELGHNIIGKTWTDGRVAYGYNPKATHLIDDDGDKDKTHCDNTCALKSGTETVGYCSDCWQAVDLALSFDPNLYNP